MNRLYIVALPSEKYTKQVTTMLDGNKQVTFWFTNISNVVFVETSLTSKKITEFLNPVLDNQSIFVGRVSDDYWGRLPKSQWGYFKKHGNPAI